MSAQHFETVDYHNANQHKRGNSVKLYREGTSLEYPYLLLQTEKLEMYRIEAMKGILERSNSTQQEDYLNVYIGLSNQYVLIGVLNQSKLKIILNSKVFDTFTKSVSRHEEERIEGDMLYALCLTKI